MGRLLVLLVALGLALGGLGGCRRSSEEQATPGRTRIVFKFQPLWGDPKPFRELLARYERDNPDVELVTEALPNSSDLAHQFFLTSLQGKATDFDVLVADVVWVPEFARAGWVADLSEHFPPAKLREEFLPGPVDSVVVDGRTYAVPWYVDVGVLYYRTDLVPRAPRTYEELRRFTREAMAKAPGIQGYVWQGRQYEGLTCNVYEALWGHGGKSLGEGGRVLLETQAAREALAYLHGLVADGLSPRTVTGFGEEEARRVFQEGRAVFMRNWPYAWSEAQKEGSPIRGKVGIAPLPTKDGQPGWGTLGGWQLAVNAHVSPVRKKAAARLIAHLTSPEANRVLALHYARNPPRLALYDDEELRRADPFIAGLKEALVRARPRPVTPYYLLIADVLQSEFSAAVSGIRTPEESLTRAQKQVDHLTGQKTPELEEEQ